MELNFDLDSFNRALAARDLPTITADEFYGNTQKKKIKPMTKKQIEKRKMRKKMQKQSRKINRRKK